MDSESADTWSRERAALVRERVPSDGLRRLVLNLVVPLGGRPLPHGGVNSVVVDRAEDLRALHDWYGSTGGCWSTVTTTEHILGGRELLHDREGRRTTAATWKVVAFLRRHESITTREFADYWEHRHGPFARELVPPEVFGVGYVQNHAAPEEGPEPIWDGVAEMHFHDLAGVQRWGAWFRSDDGRPLREDEYEFMDPDQRLVMVTREHVVVG